MRRCEDEKMWRWEDVLQTPTIGRTLRSDALGNKQWVCSVSAVSTPAVSRWHTHTLFALGDSKLYNTIYYWSPSKAELEVVGNCAASQALKHLKFSDVFWGFASDCCFQYVLKFSINWWSFLRFWFRRLLPFYFQFGSWLGTRAAIILF